MSKKRAIGTNVLPRTICRGNPRRPSAAMNGAIDAQPLGGTTSNVTRQKIRQIHARPSDSLDSISDEEDSRQKKSIRSHVRPNKDVNAYAEIRAPRIPKEPHDPSKPAVMKYRDLPSVPVSNHFKCGSRISIPKNAFSRSLSMDSNGVSSSDEYTPMNKIPRLSNKNVINERPVARSVKNENIGKTTILHPTAPVQEIRMERAKETKKEVEVEMPKPCLISTVPKKEIKYETEERGMKKEISEEEEEREDTAHTRLKMKKARPAEELELQRNMKASMKREIKEEDIITID